MGCRVVRVLDAFCGEGGAGWGYHLAGFDVLGIDTAAPRLDHYPLDARQGDALAYIVDHGHRFDMIHASPPCTGYTRGTVMLPDRLERYGRLIAATRDALEATGRPWILENVEGARTELRNPLLLCGRMFGLGATDTDGTPLVLDRHRLFESNLLLSAPSPHVPHDRTLQVAGVYGGARRDRLEAREVRKGGYVPASLDVLRSLIGAPWMTEQGCFLAIPPAYTEHLGWQAMAQLEHVA
jgi:DNA (cytosine-5)-methyltransferase 1